MSRGSSIDVTVGAGILYIAPLGTIEPTELSLPWPFGWSSLGYTAGGNQFSYAIAVAAISDCETIDPICYRTTGRTIEVDFDLAELTALNLKRALAGGTLTNSGGIDTYLPPVIGSEVRTMLGWESEDHAERWVWRQCLQKGTVKIDRKKAPAYAQIPCNFGVERPASGSAPFRALIQHPRRSGLGLYPSTTLFPAPTLYPAV